jgi:hypothetical protein
VSFFIGEALKIEFKILCENFLNFYLGQKIFANIDSKRQFMIILKETGLHFSYYITNFIRSTCSFLFQYHFAKIFMTFKFYSTIIFYF